MSLIARRVESAAVGTGVHSQAHERRPTQRDGLNGSRETQNALCRSLAVELQQIMVMIDPDKADEEHSHGEWMMQSVELPMAAWDRAGVSPDSVPAELFPSLAVIYAEVGQLNAIARLVIAGGDSGTSRGAITGGRRVRLRPLATKIEIALRALKATT